MQVYHFIYQIAKGSYIVTLPSGLIRTANTDTLAVQGIALGKFETWHAKLFVVCHAHLVTL
jgi:hypothetical protein